MVEVPNADALIALLDPIAEELAGLGVEPIFIGECPNKFNDAGNDDLWYAVRAGRVVWEQSHFFEGETGALVEESTTFITEASRAAIIESGSEVESDIVKLLRRKLRALQLADWRGLARWRGLIALAVHRGQTLLILEAVNDEDGTVFGWDEDGFFEIGTVDRVDQEFHTPLFPRFATVAVENFDRMAEGMRGFLAPAIQDSESEASLVSLLVGAAEKIRAATSDAVAVNAGWRMGCNIYCRSLSPGEARWPTSGFVGPQVEESALKKELGDCLAQQKATSWSVLLCRCLGLAAIRDLRVTLFVDPEDAFLARDNAVWRLREDRLELLGPINQPNPFDPDHCMATFKELLHG